MRIICTICSRRKDESAVLLPASERYLGEHVALAARAAAEQQLPLYILSGKYGLISGETRIPNYDHYLQDDAVPELTKTVAGQLQQADISEIGFYVEDKASWAPYRQVIAGAAKEAGAAVHEHRIDG